MIDDAHENSAPHVHGSLFELRAIIRGMISELSAFTVGTSPSAIDTGTQPWEWTEIEGPETEVDMSTAPGKTIVKPKRI